MATVAQLLRKLADEADRGEIHEVAVLLGRSGRVVGGASATQADSRFSRTAATVMDACGAEAYHEPLTEGIPC